MGQFVNPGNSAFCDAVNSKIYVDKTGLLEYTNSVIDTTDKFICNSRPRRFGKSMTADMLTAYYSRGCESGELFSKLKIGKAEDFAKHLNRYDVIHIDVQWCMEPAGKPAKVVSFLTSRIIEELRESYAEKIPENTTSLPDVLSCINAATGKRFVIIMDEWDVLIRDEGMNREIQEEYIMFLRGMFKGSEPSKYIHLAYLTGILPMKKIKTQSALNNFDEFTMLDAGILAPFIGFTEKEVKELCTQYKVDFEKVKQWYDGYLLEEYQVYNPRAVVQVLNRNKFKSYWSQTGTYDTIVPLINMDFDGLKSVMIEMLSGTGVKVDVTSFQNDTVNFKNRDDVLTYLIHLGYLGYDQKTESVFIPNEEIRQELTNATRRKKWNELLAFQRESEELLEATLRLDEKAVAEKIEQIHMEYASAIKYHDENSLSSVLTIAYLSTMQYYFKPVREFPTGKGLADFVYIPKPEYQAEYPALVAELKWNESAESAICQIKEKKYPQSLLEYTGEILLIGINYDKKTKEHCVMIEKWITGLW